MLKHLTILCLFLVFAIQSKGQVNLVPNGSFEECHVCDNSQLAYYDLYANPPIYIPYIKNWFIAKSTPDWFSSLINQNNIGQCYGGTGGFNPPNTGYGNQYPRTDSSYIGIATYGGNWQYFPPYDYNYYKEWVGVRLIDTLNAGQCYEFTMYVSRGEKTGTIVSSIGAYFTADSIYENMVGVNFNIPVPFDSSEVQIKHNPWETIYDTTNWIQITGIFRANGGEQFLYIGNMVVNGQYPIVSLAPFGQVNECDFSYFFIDDVSLYEYKEPCNLPLTIEESKKSTISIYPNPAAENVTITLQPNPNKAELLIYTVQGQLLSQTQFTGTQTINTSTLANGFYLFVIQSNGNIIGREKAIIAH